MMRAVGRIQSVCLDHQNHRLRVRKSMRNSRWRSSSQNQKSNNHRKNHPPIEVDERNGISDADAPYVPPLPEPLIVPPLTKVHFSCFQSHRSMPVSNNVWYAVPCMTCSKLDQEVRYRCTFCCLRICTNCFQSLQKCKDRSLAELVSTSSPSKVS